jgi:hypothetical protein
VTGANVGASTTLRPWVTAQQAESLAASLTASFTPSQALLRIASEDLNQQNSTRLMYDASYSDRLACAEQPEVPR